jgi:hypothetical protein
MRYRQDPQVVPLWRLYQRSRRHGVLPAAGGLDDQEERVLQAFDLLTIVTATPPPEAPRG